MLISKKIQASNSIKQTHPNRSVWSPRKWKKENHKSHSNSTNSLTPTTTQQPQSRHFIFSAAKQKTSNKNKSRRLKLKARIYRNTTESNTCKNSVRDPALDHRSPWNRKIRAEKRNQRKTLETPQAKLNEKLWRRRSRKRLRETCVYLPENEEKKIENEK